MTRLLLVGIDGLRIDDALAGPDAPALQGLVALGSIARLNMEVPTISGPGWTSLLTGTTHADHGVVDNRFLAHRVHGKPDVLTRVHHADRSSSTFAASGWPPLLDPAGPGPVIATRLDEQRAGLHRLVVRDGETYGYRWADGEIAATSALALSASAPDASFVYLGEIDEAGHLYGGVSVEYRAALRRVDDHLSRFVELIERRAAQGEEWLVATTTDHGHLDEGGHGGGEEVVRASYLSLTAFGPTGATAPGLPAELEPHTVAPLLVERMMLAGH